MSWHDLEPMELKTFPHLVPGAYRSAVDRLAAEAEDPSRCSSCVASGVAVKVQTALGAADTTRRARAVQMRPSSQ